MTIPLTALDAPARFAPFARIVGIALVFVGLLVSVGTEYHIRDQSRWAGDLIASPARAADAAVQANAHYHLAKIDSLRRARWSLFGHGTWGLLCIVGGAALLYRGTRRRTTNAVTT